MNNQESPQSWVSTIDRKYECSSINNLIPESTKTKSQVNIKIENSSSHEILGLGYSFEHTTCQNLLHLDYESRKKTIGLLVDPIHGAGMNLWRLCIGTSDFTGTEWYSYCDESPSDTDVDLQYFMDSHFSIEMDRKFIIPILRLALSINPNLIFFASPWSPPAWMKDSNSMCGGSLLPKFYDIYAYYFVKFIQAYQAEGIKIHAITIQNEPLHETTTMPTCRWDFNGKNEQIFIRDYLGPIFHKHQISTEIWCYDHNWDDLPFRAAKYPQNVCQDPRCSQFIKGVAFHHYSALGWSSPKLMKKHRKKIPHIPFYFSEGSVFGLWGAMRLARYIKFGSSSYSGWVTFLDTKGGPNNGPFKASNSLIQRDSNTNKIIINFDYYMYTHFSKFIPSGSTVLKTHHKKRRGFEILVIKTPYLNYVVITINKSMKKRVLNISGCVEAKYSMLPNSITTTIFPINPKKKI